MNVADYGVSWGIGIDNLQNEIRGYADSCPGHKIVLLGYSQGASVITGSLVRCNERLLIEVVIADQFVRRWVAKDVRSWLRITLTRVSPLSSTLQHDVQALTTIKSPAVSRSQIQASSQGYILSTMARAIRTWLAEYPMVACRPI